MDPLFFFLFFCIGNVLIDSCIIRNVTSNWNTMEKTIKLKEISMVKLN